MDAISKTSKIDRIIKLTLLTIVGSILITISAKIKIPFYPVPMTMQTFVILLIGITCGYKIGLATVTLYLLEGLLWLGTLIGWDKPIFELGAQPFLLAELFKILLLTTLYPWIIKIRKII